MNMMELKFVQNYCDSVKLCLFTWWKPVNRPIC